MADDLTPNYGLTKPDVGASDNTWGDKLNANFDTIDEAVAAIAAALLLKISTASLLDAIKAIDGPGSGIDADTLDGQQGSAYVLVSALLDAIKAIDGPGSGIDADTLDGQQLAALLLKSQNLADVADVPTARGNLGLAPASNAEVWAGADATKPITPVRLYEASAPVALVSGASITPDFNAGINFSVTLAHNATLDNPSNRKVGQSGLILVTQDGAGSRTLAYGSHWKFPGGAPTLSTAAGKLDVISFFVVSSTLVIATLVNDLQ